MLSFHPAAEHHTPFATRKSRLTKTNGPKQASRIFCNLPFLLWSTSKQVRISSITLYRFKVSDGIIRAYYWKQTIYCPPPSKSLYGKYSSKFENLSLRGVANISSHDSILVIVTSRSIDSNSRTSLACNWRWPEVEIFRSTSSLVWKPGLKSIFAAWHCFMWVAHRKAIIPSMWASPVPW